MTDDVASGAVQYLTQFSDVTSLVGAFASPDPNFPTFAGKPWIFKNDPLTRVGGTGLAALVLSPEGDTVPSPALTTPRFMRLSVEFYVDPARDSSHNILESPGVTVQRGWTLFNAVKRRLHRTDPDMVLWGDLRTVGCSYIASGQFYEVPDTGPLGGQGHSDGLQRCQAYYEVLVFGATDALV